MKGIDNHKKGGKIMKEKTGLTGMLASVLLGAGCAAFIGAPAAYAAETDNVYVAEAVSEETAEQDPALHA